MGGETEAGERVVRVYKARCTNYSLFPKNRSLLLRYCMTGHACRMHVLAGHCMRLVTNQVHAVAGGHMHPTCMASQPSPCASSNAATQKKRAVLGKKRVVSAAGLINTNSSLSRFRLPPPIPPTPQSSSLIQKTLLTFFLTHTENACSCSSTRTENPSPPSSPLALPLGSSLATLLKPVSSARCPQGKWSQLAPAPRR